MNAPLIKTKGGLCISGGGLIRPGGGLIREQDAGGAAPFEWSGSFAKLPINAQELYAALGLDGAVSSDVEEAVDSVLLWVPDGTTLPKDEGNTATLRDASTASSVTATTDANLAGDHYPKQ